MECRQPCLLIIAKRAEMPALHCVAFFILIIPNLTVTVNHPFITCEFSESHRTAGVKFLRADTDFRAQTELCSVGKSR